MFMVAYANQDYHDEGIGHWDPTVQRSVALHDGKRAARVLSG